MKTLIFQPKRRFTQLNTKKISNDQFTFHLRRLVGLGLVQKSLDKNFYELTNSGKEFANRFNVDIEKPMLEKQAKIGALICPVRTVGRQMQYCIQERLKQPFYGYFGFMSGKVKWGETVFQTAARELEEEMGLVAETTDLIGIKHILHISQEFSERKEILEDKYFFVFRAYNPRGDFREEFPAGRNKWIGEKELLTLPKLFDDVPETITMLKQTKLTFSEQTYNGSGF